jgi:hypothetical protein
MDVDCIKREGSIILKIPGEAEYELTEGEAIRLYNALERVIPNEISELKSLCFEVKVLEIILHDAKKRMVKHMEEVGMERS